MAKVGHFVDFYLNEHPDIAQRIAKALSERAPTVGSVCTGWGVGDMVVHAMVDFFEKNDKAGLLFQG